MAENRNSVTGEASIKCTEDIVDLVEQRRAIIAPGLVLEFEISLPGHFRVLKSLKKIVHGNS